VGKLLPYFSFQGRTNRQRYWLTTLALYGVLLVTMLVAFGVPVIGGVVGFLVFLAFVAAALAVAARRMHDRNKSAWWLLIMYLPIFLLSTLSRLASMSDREVGAASALLSLPFSIWALVELGCLKGTTGPNRFGPDPLQSSPAEVFS